ncbi:MAG: DUF1559 domain-containing protein, partial [Lacipirellulaceae bacterium]
MRNKTKGLTLVEGLIVQVVLFIVVGLLMPSIRTTRNPARQSMCRNNLRQVSLALLNYEKANGTLPPAYSVDESGKRLHSWRTLILPYIESGSLHELIDFTKPWDDPANAKARETPFPTYLCPSYPGEDETLTTYLAVVGPGCAFTGSEPREFSGESERAASLITVIDAPHERAVHWMSPEDITPEEVLAFDEETKWQHVGVG